ncbi:MAG: PAS domain S-box protein, partial [Methanomicrobiales archaeon]
HQIELDMQAEDLRKAKFALEESRDRFLDLYDFAPIGYLTLSDKGLIDEVNLTAATLLGVERSRLLKARFSKYFAETDVEVWHWYFINVLNQDEKKCCTLTLIRRDGSYFPARLESLRNKDSSKGTLTVRVAVSDISDIRKAEDVQQNQYSLLKGILESTGSAIFSLDCHYRYTSYNSHHAMVMKQLYGADIKKDRSIFDYQSVKEDQVKTKLNIDRALAGETFVEMAYSGEEARLRRYFEVTHSPVKDVNNMVVGVAVFAQDITDCKRAEDAMLESEERYRRITEGLTDYLYTVRVQNGQAVSTTHGAACIVVTGYTAEEFSADPYLWIHMIFEEDRDLVCRHFSGILSGKCVPPIEHRIMRKDGQIRWVRDTPILQLDADSRLVSYDGLIKDITERKQAEDAVLVSEIRYRTLVENIPQKIFLKDLNFRYISVNEKFAHDLGIRPEEMVGKTDAELFPANLAAKYHTDDIRLMETGQMEEFDERYLLKGKETWVHTIKTLVRDKDGKISGVLGVFWDITDRKQAEDSLREEQQFSKLILDSLPGIFYLYTYPEHQLTRWNRQHETLLGFSADELKGKLASDWHLPELKDAVLKATQNVMDKGESSVESNLIAKDGHTIPFFLTGVRFEAQGRLYYMGIGIDITERKRAEEQLIKTVDELRRFNNLTVDRELRMIALKQEINALLKNTGKTEKYRIGP